MDLSNADPSLDPPFTFEVLTTALKNTRPTTPGEDDISVNFFKRLSENHLPTVLRIFNNISDTGVIPSSWKSALIIPILK